MREINVSRARDPVHAGDKALTRETPAKRGRVNRYVDLKIIWSSAYNGHHQLFVSNLHVLSCC